MQQKPAEEFVDLERHDLHAVVVGIVLPPKPDAAVAVIDEPIIRERDAVGVPTEVAEDLLGAGEGALGIHDPVDSPQLTEEAGEGGAFGQMRRAPGEGAAVRPRTRVAGRRDISRERRSTGLGPETEGRATGDPPRAVRGQGAAGDQTMEMEVLSEILPPRVEDRGDTDRAAEVTRVTAEREQRVGGRAEKERVDHPGIALGERVEVCGSVKTT